MLVSPHPKSGYTNKGQNSSKANRLKSYISSGLRRRAYRDSNAGPSAADAIRSYQQKQLGDLAETDTCE